MKNGRKLMLLFLLVMVVFPGKVKAQSSFGDFPYSGTYLTEENNYLHGFHINEENQTMTILTQESNENTQRVLDIVNNYIGVESISPLSEAEDIQAAREEWGLGDLNFENILRNAADQVEPWMTRNDVMKLVQQQIPGLYVYNHGYDRPYAEIMLAQPRIQASQDLWIVGLLGNPRILRFEMGSDVEILVDEYGVEYYRVDEGSDLDE